MKNKPDYRWQGEPVKVEFGYCRTEYNKEKPLWWSNFECYPDTMAAIEAIRITDKRGYSFMISNQFGIGVNKLLKGGWPDQRHYSLYGEFDKYRTPHCKEFDEESFVIYEQMRRKWQKTFFPEEFKEMEALKNAMKRFH